MRMSEVVENEIAVVEDTTAVSHINQLDLVDIDYEGNLNNLGSNMNQLLLEPELIKMILSGVKYKCIIII